MIELSQLKKLAAAFAAGLCLLLGAASPSAAGTGSVSLNITKAGIFFGVGDGHGVLRYRGHSYRFSINGVSAGTLGVAQASLQGTAYNLRRASDIVGSYSAASAGISFAGGEMSTKLQNANGVLLDLRGRQVGFDLTLGLSGMTITTP
jgi:hypothetical protein